MKPKIIIADDDPGVQDIFKIIFENAGYETTILQTADRLLKNEFELPNVFLLDKQLSGSDGLEVCRHLKTREETRHIPVIIVSATPGLCDLALAAGADDFVEKPFSIQHLMSKVKAAIKNKMGK